MNRATAAASITSPPPCGQDMKKRFLTVLKIFPWLALLLVMVYLVFWGGLYDFVNGRIHRLAHSTFAEPAYRMDEPEITRVEIFLLSGDDAEAHNEIFSVSLFAPKAIVYDRISLPTEAIKPFLTLWTQQKIDYWGGSMCHDPVYGFRFYKGDQLVQETAICWHCSNFQIDDPIVGGVTYGFDAESESGQQLLEFCDQLLPCPKSE